MIDHIYMSLLLLLLFSFIGFLIASSGINKIRKVLLITVIIMAGILSYRSMFHFYGYPKMLKTSFNNTLIVSVLPDKPNKVIYIWVQEGSGQPVSYTIPFSEALAKQLMNQMARTNGKPFLADINVKLKENSPYKDSIEDVTVDPLPLFPPKK